MDYCLTFDESVTSQYLNEAAELKVRYNNALNIYHFLLEHPNQRVILWFAEDKIFNDFERKAVLSLKTEKKINNFVLCLREAKAYEKYKKSNKGEWLKILEEIKEAEVPFFFEDYVKDFETLHYYIGAGVSDVYIVENMGFKLPQVSSICIKSNVKVRALPNICQTPLPCGNIYGFFIRPEDIPIYERYIDVCEFFNVEGKQDTYYKIYTQDKHWFGNLQEIIQNLSEPFDSRFTIKQFAEARVKCGKKCFEGHKCQICKRILDLGKTLKDNDIFVDYT